MRSLWISLIVSLTLVGCAAQSDPELQAIVDDASEERHGGGFAVVVIDDDGTRTEAVAGTLIDGTPMSPDEPWLIASVTKTFVAATVMQLVDEGILSLETPVTSILDHGFIPDSTTVFDLLHHSSGIPDHLTDEYIALMRSCPARAPDPLDFVPDGQLFEPGTDWSYSNVNYLLLGEVVDDVTGKPFEVELRTRILEPLGLDDTYFQHVEDGPTPMAAAQNFFDTGPGPLSDCHMEGRRMTSGGMVSSVADLDRFYRALLGGEVVSPESLEAMLSGGLDDPNPEAYGLGIHRLSISGLEDVPLYGHGGGTVGYNTLYFIDLDSMRSIVAVSPNGFDFRNQLDDLMGWAFGP